MPDRIYSLNDRRNLIESDLEPFYDFILLTIHKGACDEALYHTNSPHSSQYKNSNHFNKTYI